MKWGTKKDDPPQRIVDYMEQGVPFKTACEAAGVNESTGHAWKRRGQAALTQAEAGLPEVEPGDAEFAAWVEALRAAEAKCHAWHVLNWRKHAAKDWRASQQFLAVKYPDLYSQRQRIEVGGVDGTPVAVEATTRDADQVTLAEALGATTAEELNVAVQALWDRLGSRSD